MRSHGQLGREVTQRNDLPVWGLDTGQVSKSFSNIRCRAVGSRPSADGAKLDAAAGRPRAQSPDSEPHHTISVHLALGPSGKLTRNNIVSRSALRGSQSTCHVTNSDNASRCDLHKSHGLCPTKPHRMVVLASASCLCMVRFPSATTFLSTAATSHLQAHHALPAGPGLHSDPHHQGFYGDDNDHAPDPEP